jgi:hypothetical protein
MIGGVVSVGFKVELKLAPKLRTQIRIRAMEACLHKIGYASRLDLLVLKLMRE